MKVFRVYTTHDQGTARVVVSAMDAQRAAFIVAASEGCPMGAIKKVVEVTPRQTRKHSAA
jgi:ferredoxin